MFLVLPLAFAVASALAGDAAFEDAMKLYKALEYEEAIPKLDAIAKRADLSPNDKATALMWLGLSHAGAGDMDNARAQLHAALKSDDTIALPDKVSPRIIAMFDELKRQVAEEKANAAKVDTPPPEQPPPDEPLDMMLVGGGVSAGVGALAIVGGSILAVLAAGSLAVANDDTQFQRDAKAALDAGNMQVAGASVLLPVGAALAATGGVLIGLSLTE